MPIFEFVAQDKQGKNFRGLLTGTNEYFVFYKLQKLGYSVVSINEKSGASREFKLKRKITLDDLVVFTRLFATVTNAGIPLDTSLSALEEQTEHEQLKKVIKGIRTEVERGASLSAAFAKYPKTFPSLYINLIKAGESGEQLDKVLNRLAIYLEKEKETKATIKAAFTYPKIVGLIVSFAMVFLVVQVVPAFQKLYKQLNIKLPPSTIILLNVSALVHRYWWLILLVAGLLFIAFLKFKTTEYGKKMLDMLLLNLPGGLGKANRRMCISRFTRTLGSMLSCGVPILTSLKTANAIVNNTTLSKEIEKVCRSVEEGGLMSTPLRTSEVFPPVVVYMIAAGEQSGRIPELMEKCADSLDKEVEHLLKRFLTILEPMITVCITFFVGFIAAAVYLPIFSILGAAGAG